MNDVRCHNNIASSIPVYYDNDMIEAIESK